MFGPVTAVVDGSWTVQSRTVGSAETAAPARPAAQASRPGSAGSAAPSHGERTLPVQSDSTPAAAASSRRSTTPPAQSGSTPAAAAASSQHSSTVASSAAHRADGGGGAPAHAWSGEQVHAAHRTGGGGAGAVASTSERWDRDDLDEALDAVYDGGAPLLGTFRLLGELHRRYGGQGVVQFCTSITDREDYAIKCVTFKRSVVRVISFARRLVFGRLRDQVRSSAHFSRVLLSVASFGQTNVAPLMLGNPLLSNVFSFAHVQPQKNNIVAPRVVSLTKISHVAVWQVHLPNFTAAAATHECMHTLRVWHPPRCRFFTNRAAFEREKRLYARPELRGMMPAVCRVVGDAGGAGLISGGRTFPPCIIVERGESLDEWVLRISPDFPTILTVLCHVAARLHQLHSAGYAHRDVKPGNILWRPRHHSWTLIDFGCAAEIGALPFGKPKQKGHSSPRRRSVRCRWQKKDVQSRDLIGNKQL